LKSIKIIPLI